jgi:putative hydrolase of the HAD superfamily
MLSNINSFVFDHCKHAYFEKNGKKISNYFEKCYLSYEIGICKPDKRIFNHMIADACLDPNRCLYIDDGEKNIEAAKEFGFATYLAQPQEDFSHLFE